MTQTIGLFALGVLLLALGADSFVKGMQGLALRVRASLFAVGASVAAFAGSVPDIAVNVSAVGLDQPGLAFGNIIGSCLVNLGLVLGLCALLRPLHVRIPLAGPLLLAGLGLGVLLLAMSWNGRIGYLDGTALLIAYVALAAFVATHRATRRTDSARAALEALGSTRNSALLLALRLLLGLALLVYGADLVVFHATHLARAWGVSDLFVGLTVVAIATSLPQLAMALRAAAANRGDEVVLGVLGSNLINLTLILGVTALLSPLEVPASLVRLEIPAVIAFGLVLYPMLRGDLDLRRSEGALLVLSFLGLTAFQVWLVRA